MSFLNRQEDFAGIGKVFCVHTNSKVQLILTFREIPQSSFLHDYMIQLNKIPGHSFQNTFRTILVYAGGILFPTIIVIIIIL